MTREDLREEVQAFLHAARELPPEDQPYLVARLVDRLDEGLGLVSEQDLTDEGSVGEDSFRITDLDWPVLFLAAVVLFFSVLFALDAVTHTPPNPGLVFLGVIACVVCLPLLGSAAANTARVRRWIREEEMWLRTGRGPAVVVRRYNNDTTFQNDASRLLEIGYEMHTLSHNWGSTRVMYVRDRL
jgi:hypothetical protein